MAASPFRHRTPFSTYGEDGIMTVVEVAPTRIAGGPLCDQFYSLFQAGSASLPEQQDLFGNHVLPPAQDGEVGISE